MRPYIKVESLSKSYGEHRVLSNLSLAIGRGEAVAVTGPSGCGKTTLLNILGLLETYDSGAIYLAGEPYPKVETRQAMLLRRNEINYLFQSFALIDSRTVRDNLMLALHYTKTDKSAKEAAIRQELGKFSILGRVQARGGVAPEVAPLRGASRRGGAKLPRKPLEVACGTPPRAVFGVAGCRTLNAHEKRPPLKGDGLASPGSREARGT